MISIKILFILKRRTFSFMIAFGSFLVFLLHFYKSASTQPDHTFEQHFKHNTSIQRVYSNTTILILENGPYSEILPNLVNRTHYLFVKQPSMICIKSLELLVGKLPKCSVYTNLHFNSMPRDYYNKLYKQMPYLDYIMSTSFTLIDDCIVNQLQISNLSQFQFSFVHHLSLFTPIFNWNLYNDLDYLAFGLSAQQQDICKYYIFRYPHDKPFVDVESNAIPVRIKNLKLN